MEYKVPNKILEIVKGNKANYLFRDNNNLIYEIITKNYKYTFPIKINNNMNIVFTKTEKAIMLAKHINIAIKNKTLKWRKIKYN